jgi:hypothetical protein
MLLELLKWLIRAQELFATMPPLAPLPKQKLVLCTQTIALAAVSLRGHGTRKKLNSHFMSHFMQTFYHS